jgi:predicted XRE-type DNA-binding protein
MINENSTIEFTRSSGNVFADMGLNDAEELLTRAKLGSTVRQIIENRNLKQQEIANILKIEQPEVSQLMQGKYHLFSEGRLFEFLNKLNKKITIKVSNYHVGEALIDVTLES